MNKVILTFTVVVGILLLNACGIKGDLYIDDAPKTATSTQLQENAK